MSKLSTNEITLNPLVIDKDSLLSELFREDSIRTRLEEILSEDILTTDKLEVIGKLIDDKLVKALAQILPYTTITTLNLTRNSMGAAGAKEIANALKINTTLAELNFTRNQIGDAGAKDIADALKVNTTINCLYLYDNRIEDAGAKEIADALKVNTTIITLNLNGNQIRAAGAKEIADALKVNTTITTLNLKYNKIEAAVAKEIADYIERNIALFKEFAQELVQNDTDSPNMILNINDLNRLKNCDKKLLKKTIGEDNANKLATKYLHPNYFNDHAFEIIGVCEILAKNTPTEETHISDLLNENRAHIFSFLSPSDCTVSEVNTDANEVPMVGDVEAA